MAAPKVTISGSYGKHLPRILAAREQLLALGCEVLRPASDQLVSAPGEPARLAGDPQEAADIARAQLDAIAASDVLFVVNPGGYVGPAATFEVGYAHHAGIPVVCAEPPFEERVAAVACVGNTERALRETRR